MIRWWIEASDCVWTLRKFCESVCGNPPKMQTPGNEVMIDNFAIQTLALRARAIIHFHSIIDLHDEPST